MTRQEWLAEAERHDAKARELYDADDVGSMYDYHCRCADIARRCASDAADEVSDDRRTRAVARTAGDTGADQ
jgi:hypothetical protein